MPKLDLQISRPALLLNRIAQRYSKLARILMEYVDNSLDDAERYYNREIGQYGKAVKIQIGISQEPAMVVITDNCNGMDKKQLKRLIQNVGESQKHSKFTNGQFGFGVHAFRAAAQTLSIFSKTEGGDTYVLHIDRDSMNFHPPKRSDTFHIKTVGGTQVILRDIDPSWVQGLTVPDFTREIQYHFDGLLRRKNLKIVVKDATHVAKLCRPFSYRGIQGSRLKKSFTIDDSPVKVALFVSTVPIPNNSCYFTAHGRRINEVYEVKSFMKVSRARYGVWNHPHVTGYIEVGDFVEPVITRDEFRRTQKRIALYKLIITKVEPKLQELVEEVNNERRTLEMGRLGNILSKCFNAAVRQDNHRMEGQASYVEQIMKDPTSKGGKRKLPKEWEEDVPEEQEILENQENPEIIPQDNSEQPQNEQPPAKKQKREGKLTKLKKVKGQFQMVFVKELNDAEGVIQRGCLIGDDMFINLSHPDFQERMVLSKTGAKLQITQRLNAYIANVSANSYKQAVLQRTPEGMAKYVDDHEILFCEVMDLSLSIERQLRKYMPAIQKEVTQD